MLKYFIEDKLVNLDVNNDLIVSIKKEIIPLENGKRIIYKLLTKKTIKLHSFVIDLPFKYNKNDYICPNGYQSWTDTLVTKRNGKMHSLSHLPKSIKDMYCFEYYGDSYFKKYNSKSSYFHGFSFAYILGNEDTLFASLNERNYYTIFNFDKSDYVHVESDVEGEIVEKETTLLDFIVINGKISELFNTYKELLNYKVIDKEINGYTTWYNYYQNINEDIILRDLSSLDDSYNLFQIDDGYATAVGDFKNIDKTKFPHGLKFVVDKIHASHKLAGIWLAPFIGEEKSETFINHPDWFIKKDGKPLKVGTNWSGFYALDFDKKEVKEYIKSELNYLVNEVGFDFIKIDFLHAVCINHQNKSRAKQMYQALEFIRECVPNTLILGCGVPLASAFRVVDYCRIGPDVSLIFDDVWFMKFMHRERISTKITLQNTINRYYINGIGFNNDPDVYIMRKENVKLSDKQKEALIIINFIFGSIYMTSDNIANYDASKKELMQKYQEFKHHKVISITYDKKYIKFVTEFNKNRYNFSYDTKKGELIYGKI